MIKVKSSVKIITSGEVPTVVTLKKGEFAYGLIEGKVRYFGNVAGTAVIELTPKAYSALAGGGISINEDREISIPDDAITDAKIGDRTITATATDDETLTGTPTTLLSSLSGRIKALLARFNATTGHKHDGTDSPKVAYSDLTGTPDIPAAQVNSDWKATSGAAKILNKPVIFIGSAPPVSGFNDGDIFIVGQECVEIAGVQWATTNLIADPNDPTGMTSVFAPTPDSYGDLYQWGRKKAWDKNNLTGWENVTVAGENSVWPAANNPCPSGWRLPTVAEYNSLTGSYSVGVEANERDNAVAGMFFGDNRDVATLADPRGCIFMPAAGRVEIGVYNIGWGIRGWYWLQGEFSTDNAYNFHFYHGFPFVESNNPKKWGFSLRCVKI